MITVLAGDFPADSVVSLKKSMGGLGKPTHLVFRLGTFKTEAVALADVMEAEQVTETGLNAARAVAGGLLFGFLGAAVGAIAGSGKVAALAFRDGRKVLVKCGGQDFAMLTAAAFPNKAATV